jgi:hypothetical protein
MKTTSQGPTQPATQDGKRPRKLSVVKSPAPSRIVLISRTGKSVARRKTGKKRVGAVVSIPSPRQKISQEDLEELILLRRQAREAKETLEAKEAHLLAALRAGARIEPGIHTIALGQHLELDGGKVD